MLYTTPKTFEHGNKAGRLLAYLARPEYTPISIPWIQLSTGHIGNTLQGIVNAFLSFYTDHYATKAHYSEYLLSNYLAQISLPSLSTHKGEELDASLSIEEIALAISQTTCP